MDIEELPERTRKKLPRYPVPALGVARLAIDHSAQSMGIGGQLLRFVLKIAAGMAENVGCAGVLVDAKLGAIDFYAKYGFRPIESLEGQSEERPQPTSMWLGMNAIKRSLEPAH